MRANSAMAKVLACIKSGAIDRAEMAQACGVTETQVQAALKNLIGRNLICKTQNTPRKGRIGAPRAQYEIAGKAVYKQDYTGINSVFGMGTL